MCFHLYNFKNTILSIFFVCCCYSFPSSLVIFCILCWFSAQVLLWRASGFSFRTDDCSLSELIRLQGYNVISRLTFKQISFIMTALYLRAQLLTWPCHLTVLTGTQNRYKIELLISKIPTPSPIRLVQK